MGAQSEVKRLRLREAVGLAATEERMLWPGIWKHYHAPNGLENVLRQYLDEARIDQLCFNTKVERIDVNEGASKWVVTGSRVEWGDDGERKQERSVVYDQPDAVVFCIAAPDALQIEGLLDWMQPLECQILQAVEYDSRAVVAVCYSQDLQRAIGSCFTSQAGRSTNDSSSIDS